MEPQPIVRFRSAALPLELDLRAARRRNDPGRVPKHGENSVADDTQHAPASGLHRPLGDSDALRIKSRPATSPKRS